MPLEVRKKGRMAEFVSDIHGLQRGDKLHMEVTFAVEATVEHLAAAFYMDGSGSMENAGNYGRRGGLFGLGRQRNPVQEAMRVAVPYVAGKDANSRCRVAYWACGEGGTEIEPIREMTAEEAANGEFPGPQNFGGGTYLLPAVRDFVAYIKSLQGNGERVEAALAVIVTDGQFHDAEEVIAYTAESLAPAIVAGKFPKTVFTVVGIGREVDPELMEEFSHEATPESYPGRDIWCYALAEEISQLPQLVTHLVEANTPAFYGGCVVTDPSEKIVLQFEDMVPTVIEFELALDARSFTLRAGEQSFTQQFEVIEAEHEGE